MNKYMTFDEWLSLNGLPTVGTVITTSTDEKVEIIGYAYSILDKAPRARCRSKEREFLFDLYLEQVRECTWEGKDETVFD